ncbi:MAG: serine/threonine protein phosphatase PrpC [Chlamydiales bacterium]|jgi:serine/threonine protein phosphatase PrpC
MYITPLGPALIPTNTIQTPQNLISFVLTNGTFLLPAALALMPSSSRTYFRDRHVMHMPSSQPCLGGVKNLLNRTRKVLQRLRHTMHPSFQQRKTLLDDDPTKHAHNVQIKAPFEVQENSAVSLDDIDKREYRIHIDAHEVARRLETEKSDAINQQKNENHYENFNQQMKLLSSNDNTTLHFGYLNSIIGYHKTPVTFSSPSFGVGMAEAQGRRPTMEDSHISNSFHFKAGVSSRRVRITGIFDGHGGPEVSNFAADNIVKHLVRRLEEQNRDSLSELGIWNALKLTFVDLSRSYNPTKPNYNAGSGSTANVALMINGDLWTVNLGDSRAILLDPDGITTQLSEDANPGNDKYKKGIQDRGHSVFTKFGGIPRIDGRLAVARSFGDHYLKGAVSARPKITKFPQPKDGWKDYYLIQCCDGIYDASSSSQVGDLAYARLQKGDSLGAVASKIVKAAHQAGSEDNLSAIVSSLFIYRAYLTRSYEQSS